MSDSRSNWDEAWACPVCKLEIAMGNGKNGGGNCVVTFVVPPRCYCGREMEQRTHIASSPEDAA